MMHLSVSIFLIGLTVPCSSLGGKSFASAHASLKAKNYAVLTLCEGDESIMNITLTMIGEDQPYIIQFTKAKQAFEIPSFTQNISSVSLSSDTTPSLLNPMQVTVRMSDNLYKLHLNPLCSTSSNFYTSASMTSIWRRHLDCSRDDQFCDNRVDELTQCDAPFTHHLFWKDGISMYGDPST